MAVKLGMNEATCKENSTLEQDLMLCEKYHYSYIEIRLDMLKDYLQRHSIAELQSFFAASNVKPYAFNSIEDINFRTEEQWAKVVELFTFACEAGQKIGNPYIVVVPTMDDAMINKTEQEIFEDSVKVLRKLSDIAAPYDMKLAFEPIGNPRWCVRNLRQCMAIIDAVDRQNVGVAIDAFNLFLYDKLQDMAAIDLVPAEKIFVYHIDDSENLPLAELDHCHRLFPGDGVIPLAEITQRLHKKGYEGVASVELFRPEYWAMDPDDVFRLAAEKTRKFL
ncbi:sugar phosphate isomerase/epimerase|uniref:2-keto-myo-inositol isomerase n=1 Tax=Dendrosporobacter quercicolus TaxID=146817 RepID=A0A1G9SU86_9FIRM|nr:sugar phosphate isomerase/epimerase [Dendrosporobacter quercicolus]NSL48615.1 sugar phosphate isomerase/epimerase [Dendrosporobacter quercicolus DSM 1736]SDM38973.1 2-keto-myo-inositol isomerase [Dendrosporobacter quercicolus]